MTESTLWWMATGILIAIELMTGTFYLLMIAIGLAAAALTAHAGIGLIGQCISAALVGGGTVLAWHLAKRRQTSPTPVQANHDVNMDIGATVHVERWLDNNTCSVHYRGAHWDAALLPGAQALRGDHEIAEVVGSKLILKPIPTHG